MKRVYYKLLLRSESLVFCQRVIHATDFTHSRHENEDRGRVSRKAVIFETYALQQAKDQVIRNLPLVQKVDGFSCPCRVSFLQLGVLYDSILSVFVFRDRVVLRPFGSILAATVSATIYKYG